MWIKTLLIFNKNICIFQIKLEVFDPWIAKSHCKTHQYICCIENKKNINVNQIQAHVLAIELRCMSNEGKRRQKKEMLAQRRGMKMLYSGAWFFLWFQFIRKMLFDKNKRVLFIYLNVGLPLRWWF
jgi:hypothetical protein